MSAEAEIVCNAVDREEAGCNADGGMPCPACDAALDREAAYWKAYLSVEANRPVENYREQMVDAGRGRLLGDE